VNVRPCRTGTFATVLVALTVLAAIAGCGGTSSNQPVSDAPAAGATSPTGAVEAGSGGGPSGTVKLTGYYTYDGPFTGEFSCRHLDSGHFSLAGQQPYRIEILVQEMREGTFVVHEQDRETGIQKADPGQPKIGVTGLGRDEDANKPDETLFRVTGGTITFTDGGDSGTLIADFVGEHLNDFGGKQEKAHAELHWANCG
jgi:hypothetical protein